MQAGQESRLVDPLTGGFTQDGGNAKKIPAELAAVVMLLFIADGSVPGCPWYTSRLHLLGHKKKSWPAQAVAEIDRILRPWRDKLYDSYQRRAWIREDGVRCIYIQIRRGDITADRTLPADFSAAA
jgi:hypothetical protein